MSTNVIDLRSDTVTRPTAGMREAMARAEVGDDVFDEDPTVHELQDRVAAYFGMESALFVPSGTMANQIAIRLHTRPGDELICESTSHIFVWEAGGPAALSGVTCRTVDADGGLLDASQLTDLIRPDNEHYAQTRLVCLENTHNRGGGRAYRLAAAKRISEWARSHNLKMHLDGARIWNALAATGESSTAWGSLFDTISVCFSKGLGAPIGSCLIGSRTSIERGRRIRKLFGGAMRQVGIVAAACLYAMDHHIDRLREDHDHAKLIARAVAECPRTRLVPPVVETNLVWFEVDREFATGRDVQTMLQERGVLTSCLGPQVIRACTHLNISAGDAERAAQIIRETLRGSIRRVVNHADSD